MMPPLPDDALVLLIGPAASGKSTWAARQFAPGQVLSSDAFRELVAGDSSDQSATADAFRLLHGAVGARLKRGLLTVVDATNLQSSARRPLLALARRSGRPCVAVVFDPPLDVLLEQNRGRDRVVPEEVVHRHHAAMARTLRDLPGEGYLSIMQPLDIGISAARMSDH